MALSLVEMLEEPFDPSKYHDQYRVALLEMIEAKRDGSQVVAPPEAPVARTADLMAALKASLEAAKKAKTTGSDLVVTPATTEDGQQTGEEIAVA